MDDDHSKPVRIEHSSTSPRARPGSPAPEPRHLPATLRHLDGPRTGTVNMSPPYGAVRTIQVLGNDALRPCLRALRRLLMAETVSLYLPTPAADEAGAILIHEGDSALPELADLAAAQEFARRVEAEPVDGADRNKLMVQRLSADDDGRLIRLATPGSLLAYLETAGAGDPTSLPARRRSDAPSGSGPPAPAVWIGLRSATGLDLDWPTALDNAKTSEQSWVWSLGLSAALAWHEQQVGAINNDPVSSLPARAQFQASMERAMERARKIRRRLVLILINPLDFVVVTENFGREARDSVIREIADRLRASKRSSDLIGRYSDTVFALCLMDTEAEIGRLVAEKLRRNLTEGAYLTGAVRLGFGCGLAGYEPAGSSPGQERDEPSTLFELVRRADRALNLAMQSPLGRALVWRDQVETAQVGTLDRLSGIFTANLAKDYRNMLFLWDTVNIVSKSSDFESLAKRVVERMQTTFKADKVALYRWTDEEGFRLVEGKVQGTPAQTVAAYPEASDALEQRLLAEARQTSEAAEDLETRSEGGRGHFCFAVPLIARQNCLGCLYVEGHEDAKNLDRSDLIFLKALAGQLAVTLDRSLLAAQERLRQERERQLMRSELNELRRALQEARLVYRSAEMETVVSLLRRLAPTDATLMITGESGTGKELLARTAHELSPRAKNPFIVVDCGAIAAPLIERELFGHEKGAYTGAENSRSGRLAEAAGGSIILDEIGELPLEVQTRFLRFAQEKQLTPVGGTRPREIDVRLIAVTNRDLEQEVAAGRFRADLFYRLNVAPVVVPPLRDRPDDIIYLAQHFLERFSVQYQKGIRTISAKAQELLLTHRWPGNVRELQNRILRAVILCEGTELGSADLELETSSSSQLPLRTRVAPEASPAALPSEPSAQAAASPQHVWHSLEVALRQQVDTALDTRTLLPLGKWLAEDLILEADSVAQGVTKHGAELLGIPETTFRRRLRKTVAQTKAGLSPRPGDWSTVRPLIADLFKAGKPPAGDGLGAADALKRARSILLRQVVLARPGNAPVGASLMGITEPTFKRWAAALPVEPKLS